MELAPMTLGRAACMQCGGNPQTAQTRFVGHWEKSRTLEFGQPRSLSRDFKVRVRDRIVSRTVKNIIFKKRLPRFNVRLFFESPSQMHFLTPKSTSIIMRVIMS